jgi:hypothetical protein
LHSRTIPAHIENRYRIFSVKTFKRRIAAFRKNNPAFRYDVPVYFEIFRNTYSHGVVKKHKKQNNGLRHHSHAYPIVGTGIAVVPTE